MHTINTMLIIDIIIIILGIYLLSLAIKMRKSKKVDRFIVAEETMKICKNEIEFAEYLSMRVCCFSLVLILGGSLMVLHESVFDMGKWIYIVIAIVAIAFLVFYKQLTDGKIKYC